MTTDDPSSAAAPATSTDRGATDAAEGDTRVEAPRQLPRWRRILVGTLVVIGCLLAPLSILGVWVHSTLLETDQWVATVGPLIDDPVVQDAVAARVTNAVISSTDLERRVRDLLPGASKALAPVIEQGAQQATEVAAQRIVQSDQFETLWDEVNRRAHSRVVAVLQGEGTQTVATKNGEITLDLGPIIAEVREELDDRGITFFDNVKIPSERRRIVLFSSDDLATAQGATDLLDTLATILPIATFLVLAAAVALSGNRRRTILRAALGVALAMGILLTALALGRTQYLDALPDSVNHDAARVVYDQIVLFLRTSVRTTFALAIVVALGAWLAGAGHGAVRVRGTVGRALARGGDQLDTPTPVAGFVWNYRNVLRVLVVGLGFVTMAVLNHPTPVSVLVVVVLVLIALGVIEILGRAAQRSTTATS
jgi:hypothetical protein